MHSRQHIQKKAPSSSSSTPVPTSIFGQRSFENETDSAVPPQQQETPDLQSQLEKAARFGHNFGRVQVGDTPAVIQPKLAIGAPGDKYEQEADQMAAQVMSMAAPANQQSVQREMAPEEEKEKLQTKPLAASITPLVQREMAPKPEEEEEPVQAKPLAGFTIQREMAPKPEEEEQPVQTKPLAGFTIQREMAPKPEEEEQPLQAKPLAGSTIQREIAPKPEQEEQPLQTKPSLQRVTEADGNDPSSSLENQLSSSKGGGSPLSDEVRSFMEPRFGADFSSVRVHTGGEAVQMNRGLGAQAFAHGNDIYFGAGKSPGNNELTAHELTHVVQQSGSAGFSQSSAPVQKQSKGGGAKPKGKTNFKEQNKTYTITAKTLQEAADQISQREEAGETTWKPKHNFKTDESGNVTDATVDVTITVTMPSWPGSAKLSKAAKAEWDRSFKVLKAHEEKHAELVRSKLKGLAESLVGKTQTEAEATFDAALTELQQASDDYDTSSNHGRNEGTDLDTSVETSKTVEPVLE